MCVFMYVSIYLFVYIQTSNIVNLVSRVCLRMTVVVIVNCVMIVTAAVCMNGQNTTAASHSFIHKTEKKNISNYKEVIFIMLNEGSEREIKRGR